MMRKLIAISLLGISIALSGCGDSGSSAPVYPQTSISAKDLTTVKDWHSLSVGNLVAVEFKDNINITKFLILKVSYAVSWDDTIMFNSDAGDMCYKISKFMTMINSATLIEGGE